MVGLPIEPEIILAVLSCLGLWLIGKGLRIPRSRPWEESAAMKRAALIGLGLLLQAAFVLYLLFPAAPLAPWWEILLWGYGWFIPFRLLAAYLESR